MCNSSKSVFLFLSNGTIVIELEMDSKNYTQIISSVDTQDDLSKSQTKSNPNDTNTLRKQMPSANLSEPKQRVIKQIVSLDSKKLKDLGIESNILSALTKFNGKKAPFFKTKPTVSVKNVGTSSSVVSTNVANEFATQKPSLNVNVATNKPNIASQNVPAANKIPETSSAKKIHVLSNVLLSEKKLDLKELTVIASSTPIHSTNIPYVPQVPQNSQIETIQPAIAETLNPACEMPLNPNTLDIHPLSANTPILDGKSSQQPHQIETKSSISETDELLKGFSVTELSCSNKQLELIQNEFHSKSTSPPTAGTRNRTQFTRKSKSKTEPKRIFKGESTNEMNSIETETVEEIQTEIEAETKITTQLATQEQIVTEEKIVADPKIGEVLNETHCQNTSLSNSENILSEPSSCGTESDLETLIKEAQFTNEKNNESPMITVSDAVPSISKKPRRVQKELLDLLVDHVEKDRIIDEFSDSSINSFHTECTSLSDGDSIIENHNASTDNANERFEEKIVEDTSIQNAVENVSVELPLKLECDEMTEVQFISEKSISGSRKRKSSIKSRVSKRRKQSPSPVADDSESNSDATSKLDEENPVSSCETPNILPEELRDVPIEIDQGK